METSDYYCPCTVTGTLGYGLGRGIGVAKTVTFEAVNPATAGVIVGTAWGFVTALMNFSKHKLGTMTTMDSVIDTAGETVCIGLSSVAGLLASNAIRASSLLITTATLVPFPIGVVVPVGSKVAFDCNVRRQFQCEEEK